MEIELKIRYDEFSPEGPRLSDGIVRDVSRRFPDAVWERHHEGWRIVV